MTYITILGVLGVFSFLYAVLMNGSDVVNPKLRSEFSDWLKDRPLKREINDPIIWFNTTFDRVFGTKHFSAKCFLRSAMISIILSFIFRIILDLNNDGPDYVYSNTGFPVKVVPNFVIGTLYEAVLFDYLSLLVTRYFLKILVNSSTSLKISLAVLDIVVAVALAYFGIAFELWNNEFPQVSEIMINNNAGAFVEPMKDRVWIMSFEKLKTALFFDSDIVIDAHGQWVYSTFFTTIWVYIYLFSVGIIRLLNSWNMKFKFLNKYLDIENKPFKSISYVILTFGVMLFLMICLFRLIV